MKHICTLKMFKNPLIPSNCLPLSQRGISTYFDFLEMSEGEAENAYWVSS